MSNLNPSHIYFILMFSLIAIFVYVELFHYENKFIRLFVLWSVLAVGVLGVIVGGVLTATGNYY